MVRASPFLSRETENYISGLSCIIDILHGLIIHKMLDDTADISLILIEVCDSVMRFINGFCMIV